MVGVIGLALAPLVHGFPGTRRHLTAPIRPLHPEGRQLGFGGGGGGESFCVLKQICLLSKPPHPPQQAALLIFWPATISLRDASFQRNNLSSREVAGKLCFGGVQRLRYSRKVERAQSFSKPNLQSSSS